MTFMQFAGIPGWAVAAVVAAAAGLLGVLHLLRVRPREIRVVTTLFWAHAVEQARARTLLERFRHPWTYALLLLLCALLAFALGQPRRTSEPANRMWEVIVVNGGASMTAPDAESGGTRFDAARQAAVAEADRLSLDDRLAVVIADPLPRLVHRFDEPRPLVRRTLRATAPADMPAATDEAIALARSLLHGRSRGRIVVITDRAAEADASTAAKGIADVRLVRVGTPADNAAILSTIFEPSRDNPLRGKLTVRVGYWGKQPRDARLEVKRLGGAPLLNQTLAIEPGGTRDFVVADLQTDGDTLDVRLGPDDAVMADNRATIRLPLRAPIRVAVESGQGSGSRVQEAGAHAAGTLPAPLRVALESDPAVRIVEAGQARDIDVIRTAGILPANRREEAGKMPAIHVSRPSLIVLDSGPGAPTGKAIRTMGDSPLIRNLDFEAATCGSGASIGDVAARNPEPGTRNPTPLLIADDAILAAINKNGSAPTVNGRSPEPETRSLEPACVYLAAALFADDATVSHRAAFAIFVARATRLLAGWDDDPIILTPERAIADPLWAKRTGHDNVAAAPGDRDVSDLAAATAAGVNATSAEGGRWSLPSAFEVLLLAAVACFLLEAVLHTRGRIS
jgi:hypothetical protein